MYIHVCVHIYITLIVNVRHFKTIITILEIYLLATLASSWHQQDLLSALCTHLQLVCPDQRDF